MEGRQGQVAILVQQHGFTYPEVREVARKAEQLGLHSLWIWDHFFGPLGSQRPDRKPLLEAWTTLSALAEATSKLRLGTLVTAMSYRQPSLLAKIISCLDHISNGRVEVGVGAGWYMREYQAYGYTFPPAATRIEQLREGIAIMKAMWTEPKASFKGKHFTVHEAQNDPKPVQKPHPLIWIGGWGEKLLLRAVAELADGYNTGWLSIAEYRHKLGVLRRHCADVGRKFDAIQLSYVGNLHLQRQARKEMSEDGNFGGDPSNCVQKIRSYWAEGADLVILGLDSGDFDSMNLLSEEVLPELYKQ